jgi:hypothetical protein
MKSTFHSLIKVVSSSFDKDQRNHYWFLKLAWNFIHFTCHRWCHILIVYFKKIQNHIIVEKRFSTLIQVIVNAKYSFWDDNYGWVGTIHN